MERKATPRQVAYIERLSLGNGLKTEKPLSELTMTEASELIQQIAAKGQRNGIEQNNENKRSGFNNGAQLGMAFKCCYARWVGSGKNIIEEHRKPFIKNVLDTYVLINEIAWKAAEVAA